MSLVEDKPTEWKVVTASCKVDGCDVSLIPFAETVFKHLNKHLQNKEVLKVRKYPAAVDFVTLDNKNKRIWCYKN